jgi:NADPH:quinone reductase-like Zn-dependent oxidoreductase
MCCVSTKKSLLPLLVQDCNHLNITPIVHSTSLPINSNPTMSTNKAAWQKTFKAPSLTISTAPTPIPQPHQILIKARAIGINPADAAVQKLGLIYDASKYPIILGFDVAGEVEAIGDAVTRFKPGDRVLSFPIDLGSGEEEYKSQRGAFQLYCVANDALSAIFPESVSFAEAAVFPSCLSTAAYALFMKDAMALSLPPVSGRAEPNGQVVVVWGGSSVVGSCAIQMATLAGYEVVATSSERNFEHCRRLGAVHVFDYKSERVIEDVVAACEGKKSAGVFVAYYNDESTVTCSHIASRLGGNAVVGTVVPPHLPTPEAAAQDVRITSSTILMSTQKISKEYTDTPSQTGAPVLARLKKASTSGRNGLLQRSRTAGCSSRHGQRSQGRVLRHSRVLSTPCLAGHTCST